MSIPAHVLLESVELRTAFGAGFWDVVGGRLVTDGLRVRLHATPGGPRVVAAATRAQLFVAHRLPGAPPVLVEVRDERDRFVPFMFEVPSPSPRSLAVPACTVELAGVSAAVGPARYVPLLRAPSCPAPAGMAAVRGSLREAASGCPAAFALVEVRALGRLLARGLADARGQVAAFLPYPEPADSPLWSPPRPRPLAEQTWSLDLTVRYRPGLPRHVVDPALEPLVDLCDVMHQPVTAAYVASSPSTVCSNATLRYGEDLVLGAEQGASELYLTPA